MKKFFLFFSFVIICSFGWYFASVYSYHYWFDTHLVGSIWTVTKEKELKEILNQPFFYCGQGSTSKAYQSQDGRFVIKRFLEKQVESKKCKSIPFVRDLAKKRKQLKIQYERSFGPIYAYQYIPRETGMIFYQLIKPRDLFHRSIPLIEKDGSSSLLNLDRDEYVIQKKAVIVSAYLKEHLAKNDLEKVKQGIDRLITLTKTLYDQGIVLVVLQFLDNFGFVDDEPIRIDVEHICFDPKWKEQGKAHLKKELALFRDWIVENAPQEIVDFFDQCIKKSDEKSFGQVRG